MLTADAQGVADRFWSKVDTSGECWIWQSVTMAAGYGKFKIGGRMAYAHRVAWVLTHGEILDGFDVHHKCGNQRCVRPDHLESLSHVEHMSIRTPKPLPVACENGHAWTLENTYISPKGKRCCRACNRQAARAYQQRRGREA